jgi:hypothetical protein
MLQGLQAIIDYKGISRCVEPNEASLSDELNIFCAHFEADNAEPSRKALVLSDDQVTSLSEVDV